MPNHLTPEESEARKGIRAIIAAVIAVPLLIGIPAFLVSQHPMPEPQPVAVSDAPASNWEAPNNIGSFENDARFASPTATPYIAPSYTAAPSWNSGSSSTDASGFTPSRSGGRTGARCRDGSYSSATGRGACSHHGGVAEWLYS